MPIIFIATQPAEYALVIFTVTSSGLVVACLPLDPKFATEPRMTDF